MTTKALNRIAAVRGLAVACGLAVVVALAPAGIAQAEPPREGDAPKTRVESRASSQSSARASRPSSPGARGNSGAGRTRPSTPGNVDSGSGGRTRVEGRSSARRPYRGSRYYGHGYYGRGYYGHRHYGFYGHYPYYLWPWGYGVVIGHYPYRYPYYYDYAYRRGAELGALDFDVRPEKAEIWIDGQFVGVADEYDGFPSYLWLERGTYDVVIYRPGFVTIARQYSIYPGVVIDVEDRMVPGESKTPQELAPKTAVKRQERTDRDAERRDYARRERREAGEGELLDARGEPGQVSLKVTPSDASVYLDGRFLGTADELSRLHGGLIVDPGEHTVEIVRPGYVSEEETFDVAAGEEVILRVDLEEK